ncbi:MAG: hypothetical protein NDI93_01380 [Pseudomonas sp.]|nr:hypothetical protein [Pseudomonas sp.]
MNIKQTTGRLVVYTFLYAIIFLAVRKLEICVSGEAAFRLFFYVSALSGLIQTINLAVIKKSEDIKSGVRLTLLRAIQLQHNLRNRRQAAFARCIYGIGSSLAAAITASALNFLKDAPAPHYLFAFATFFALLSVVFLFLTLYEFKSISDFESELLDAQAADEEAKKAVDDLLKEKKE